ncbi:MAG: ComEC/Rec2 family competence protein, partial [Coriobacteriia bacterium]|nr:ComEC/Rec2 family competence protein [Coriobacteriia bacterium]
DPRDGKFGATGEVVIREGKHQGQRIELRYGRDMDVLELGQSARVSGIMQAIPFEARQQHRFDKGLSATFTVQSLSDVHYQSDPLGWLWQLRFQMQERLRAVAAGSAAAASEDAAAPSSDNHNEAFGLLTGMTFGDRRELKETPLEGALQRTGLAHFLAVSGTHLGLLGALLFFALSKTRLTRLASGSITLAVCACYVFFTGFAPGSIRSCVMLAFALLVYVLKRRICVLSSLALAGLLMLMLDPLMAVSLGFLLSFGSVAAIVVFSRYLQQWVTCLLPVPYRHRLKGVTGGFALSVVASTATLPLTLEAFGIFPIVGPLANLVFGPALCAMLGLSLIANALAVVLPPLGTVLLQICLWYSQLLGSAVKAVASLSWASMPMGGFSTLALCVFLGSIVALWLWWPRPNKQALLRTLAAAACVLLLFGTATQLGVAFEQARGVKSITVLDVGQGDALLVRDGAHTVLVDAGPSPAVLREQLREQRIRRIDTLIFTHDHADHARGAQVLDASYGVRQIIVAAGAEDSPVYRDIAQRVNAPVLGALAGDTVVLDYLEIRFIWPYQPVSCPSSNDTSLTKLIVDTACESIDHNPLDIVFSSGDAEADHLRRALSRPELQAALIVNGHARTVDIILVPHHGSKKSLDNRMIERLIWEEGVQSSDKKGAIAIFSVGSGNQFGHPRAEPLELIEEYFLKMYRTDLDGSVTIEL